ncbi:MAG: hypothetical protein IEMM0002_0869 [bacterium]|nr:MAG: hypothetical protein IEMM0002_0869 [bacterium]
MKNETDDLIEEQQKNHTSLLDFSKRLIAAVKEENSDDVLETLMEKRQGIIAGISRTGKKIKKSLAGKTSLPDKKALDKLGKTIEEILALDRESGEILRKRKSSVADKMKSINMGSAAVKGYGRDKSGGTGRFISIRK